MKKLGLVLGSGGARGLAHIGVIHALEAADIQIHAIAGASIGALVGAIYAAQELPDFEQFVRALSWREMVSYFDVVFPSSGLLDGNRIYELLSDHLKTMAIEASHVKFCCVATDLAQGQEVRLQTGPMVDAVRASIAIPGVFTPFQKGEQWLGDGGVVNPVPVDVMRDMDVDVVIAVNLNSLATATTEAEIAPGEADQTAAATTEPTRETASEITNNEASENAATASLPPRVNAILTQMQERYESLQSQVQEKLEHWLPDQKQGLNIFDVIGASLTVMEQQITHSKLEVCPPDILLEPPLGHYGIFDFHEADAIIQAGDRAMRQQLPQLRKLLATDAEADE